LRDIYERIIELLEREQTFALATIVDYKGSVPHRLAKMIITKDDKTYGTIGGACVEGQVAEEVALMLREGAKGVMIRSHDLVKEEFGGIGMTCGEKVDVSIEIVEPDPHLIIAGSGHVSHAIARLGQKVIPSFGECKSVCGMGTADWSKTT
jgi:xanthine dehydrogenase accessory factor